MPLIVPGMVCAFALVQKMVRNCRHVAGRHQVLRMAHNRLYINRYDHIADQHAQGILGQSSEDLRSVRLEPNRHVQLLTLTPFVYL